jgi:hypothetical protein
MHQVAASRNEMVKGLAPEAGALGSFLTLGWEAVARRSRAGRGSF